MRIRTSLLLCLAFFILSFATSAQDSPQPRLLRVSLVQGDVTYQRSDLDRWVDLSINTPVLEGDKIWSGRDGRVEIEFEDGTFTRLSANTIIEISRLGSLQEARDVEIQLRQGVATFEVRSSDGSFKVLAPLFTTLVRNSASFRMDVDTDGSGRLVVFEGRTEVDGQATHLYLRNGETVRFMSDDPERYYLETSYMRDDWDRWNEDRNAYLAKVTRDRYHDGDRGWTTADLDNYGSWYDVSSYGWIWRPHIGTDWVPFRSGRWCWYESLGWTWVSYEPWGWVPYHYGRWAYINSYGWSWVPGARHVPWCPGAVSWVEGPDWVGWVPLAPYEPWYPYYQNSGNVFVSRNYGHRGAWTYLPHDSFVNGTPIGNFRGPRDPREAGGRIIAGQPRIQPTTASRMPVAGNSPGRIFTNDDLEARRNLREQMLQTTGHSNGQDASTHAEVERLRRERDLLASRSVSSGGQGPGAGTGVQVINGSGGGPKITSIEGESRRYENWGRAQDRAEQRRRLQQFGSGNAVTPVSGGSQPQSLSALPQPGSASQKAPTVPSNDGASSRERIYQVYRSRTDGNGGDRFSSREQQQNSFGGRTSQSTPYTPPPSSTTPAQQRSSPSYTAPPSYPRSEPSRAPIYHAPSAPSSPSVSHSQSIDSSSGASAQESRSSGHGRSR